MENSALTIKEMSYGPPCSVVPLELAFSPDGYTLSYLYPDSSGQRQLHMLDLRDPEATAQIVSLSFDDQLSLEEQLRRERMRLFTSGLTRYQWDLSHSQPGSRRVLLPVGNTIALYDESRSERHAGGNVSIVFDGSWTETVDDGVVVDKAVTAIDPKLSPDGKKVAFVVENDLYVLYLNLSDEVKDAPAEKQREIVRVTRKGATAGVSCGLADFLAQEEMDRYEGFWWSPDSAYLAFTIVDERHVPEFVIQHLGEDPYGREVHRYPFTGKSNPIVQLAYTRVPDSFEPAVTDISDQLVITDLTALDSSRKSWGDDIYVCRVSWWSDNSIAVQIQNRAQSELHLLRIDVSSGEIQTLLQESSSVYVRLHQLLRELPADSAAVSGFRFLWGSERSGYQQLYLYSYDGVSPSARVELDGRPVGGGGDWIVDGLIAVDPVADCVYVTGNRGDPTQKQLLRLALSVHADPSAEQQQQQPVAVQVFEEHGWHTPVISVVAGICINIFSSLTCPPITIQVALPLSSSSVTLASSSSVSLLTSSTSRVIADSRQFNEIRNQRLIRCIDVPEIHSTRSTDGLVDLYYSLRRPRQDLAKSAPAILFVYGGPCVQQVTNQWLHRAALKEQYYADLGYVVVRVDNRGSDRRGVAFESSIHRNLGDIEVQDCVTVVQHLAAQGVIDPQRVGITGWSFGGYLSLAALARAPHVFHCAVAGAPVTSWDGYDSYYTERYMSHPADNISGYEASSIMTHVDKIVGSLLLVHGLIDENVHFRHTARLTRALLSKNIAHELLVLPDERHGARQLLNRLAMERRVQDFFTQHLQLRQDSTFDNSGPHLPVTISGASVLSTSQASSGPDKSQPLSPPSVKAHL